jgi:2-oxoglutarate dehydrogenase E1 component
MLQRFDFVKLEGYSRPYSSVPAPGSSTRDKKRQQNVIDAVFQAL